MQERIEQARWHRQFAQRKLLEPQAPLVESQSALDIEEKTGWQVNQTDVRIYVELFIGQLHPGSPWMRSCQQLCAVAQQ